MKHDERKSLLDLVRSQADPIDIAEHPDFYRVEEKRTPLSIDDIIHSYPDANEFISEALAKDYMESDDRQANASAILDAILARDHTEAGLILAVLCRKYAKELARKG